MKNSWSYGQYSIYRVILGLYLCIHFIWLLPWAREVFSNQGMLADGSLSPLFSLFPNILFMSDSAFAICCLISTGILASICLMLGRWDRYAALLCWYVLTCLFDRNPFISNPSLPYIGWLLLAHACLPLRKNQNEKWEVYPGVFFAAWVVMAVAYSYSGYIKLASPSWLEGSALRHVLNNPLARANEMNEFILSLPDIILKFMTWSALALELFFAPLALFKSLRPWLWISLLGMHISLLLVIRFADLSFGMIILHLFTFDPGWIKQGGEENKIIEKERTG